MNLDILRIRHGISRILCENILISFWKKTMVPVWLLDFFVNIIPQWRPPNEICLHELLLNTQIITSIFLNRKVLHWPTARIREKSDKSVMISSFSCDWRASFGWCNFSLTDCDDNNEVFDVTFDHFFIFGKSTDVLLSLSWMNANLLGVDFYLYLGS